MTKELPPHLNLSLQDMEGEQWLDIDGFEGYYQVSNMGRVKSPSKEVERGDGFFNKRKEKILKQTIRKRGSKKIYVILQINKNKYTRTVAKLVFENFFYKAEDNFVLHKDGNCENNGIWNLYLGNRDNLSDVVYKTPYRKKKKTSIYRNVHKENRGNYTRYRMNLSINGKTILENFKSELEAAKKYDYYVKKYKLDRKLNFPE